MKHYDGREGTVEAVRGVDLEVRTGEIFGFLGPNGAGKSTTVRMLTTLLSITSGQRGGRRRRTWSRDPGRGPPPDRRRASGGRPRPAPDGPRAAGHARAAVRAQRRSGEGARGGAAGAGRARGRRRPGDQGLLGRHAAPARPGGGARARARGPVPRRADHGPGPGEPADGLGGAAPDQRARHDGVPHDPVPRGGRPALRSPRDHRRRRSSCAKARPDELKADLRERRGDGAEPTLDDVFLDATGRTRDRAAGEVQEVAA